MTATQVRRRWRGRDGTTVISRLQPCSHAAHAAICNISDVVRPTERRRRAIQRGRQGDHAEEALCRIAAAVSGTRDRACRRDGVRHQERRDDARAAAAPAVMAEPDGAEDWMYLQRANADGSIPDAAVERRRSPQSKAAGQASQGSPATDQVWTELGPSNIGGRIRDIAADPDHAGRRLHRHRLAAGCGSRPTAARRSPPRGTRSCRSRWVRSQSTPTASSGPAPARSTTVAARRTTATASTSRPTTARRGPTWASGRRHDRPDRHRPARRRSRLRRRPGCAARHGAVARPVHDRGRRSHAGPA